MLGSDAVKSSSRLTHNSPNLAKRIRYLEYVSRIEKPGVLTLLFGKMNGIFLGSEREPGSLDIVRTASPSMTTPYVLERKAYELAQPINGFSQRPPPGRISQSRRQRIPFAPPLCMVLRVGWYIRTTRWRSSAEGCV